MKHCYNLRITEKEIREWLGKPYPDNYTESESQFKFTNWQQNIPELLWEIFNGSPMDIEMLRQQIKKDLSNNNNIEGVDLDKIKEEKEYEEKWKKNRQKTLEKTQHHANIFHQAGGKIGERY